MFQEIHLPSRMMQILGPYVQNTSAPEMLWPKAFAYAF